MKENCKKESQFLVKISQKWTKMVKKILSIFALSYRVTSVDFVAAKTDYFLTKQVKLQAEQKLVQQQTLS